MEELARERGRLLGREAVVGPDLDAVDPLQHRRLLGHVRPDHLRHDEPPIVGDEARDQLGVVRLLAEVELRAQVHLELVRERLELEELRRLGAPLEEARRRADDVEIEVDLLHHSRPPHLHDDRICATDAVAIGIGSMLAKASPKAPRMTGSSSANGTGGTSSTSRPSSSM